MYSLNHKPVYRIRPIMNQFDPRMEELFFPPAKKPILETKAYILVTWFITAGLMIPIKTVPSKNVLQRSGANQLFIEVRIRPHSGHIDFRHPKIGVPYTRDSKRHLPNLYADRRLTVGFHRGFCSIRSSNR